MFGLASSVGRRHLARRLHPGLADRIWTGSVMSWSPPRQFTYVTALADQVPPNRLGGDLVDRLLNRLVEAGGRLIVSAYANADEAPRNLFDDLAACGHEPDGRIYIERPDRSPLITAWLDQPPALGAVEPTRLRPRCQRSGRVDCGFRQLFGRGVP